MIMMFMLAQLFTLAVWLLPANMIGFLRECLGYVNILTANAS